MPVRGGAGRYRKCGRRHLARSNDASRRVRPRKEGQDRAGRADLVAEVKVVRAGIVEVHGELDESQAEDRRVKVQVALRITGDGGDVMNPGNRRCRHGALSVNRRMNSANRCRNIARKSRVAWSTSRPSASNFSWARATRTSGWSNA